MKRFHTFTEADDPKCKHIWGADTTNRRDLFQCSACGKRTERWRVEAAQKAATNRRIFKAIRDRTPDPDDMKTFNEHTEPQDLREEWDDWMSFENLKARDFKVSSTEYATMKHRVTAAAAVAPGLEALLRFATRAERTVINTAIQTVKMMQTPLALLNVDDGKPHISLSRKDRITKADDREQRARVR
jgi:hypothetical protein